MPDTTPSPGGSPGATGRSPVNSVEDEALVRARRRLLKAGLYAAPFVATFGAFPRVASAATKCAPPPCLPPCTPKK
jgi:hypothetical protein